MTSDEFFTAIARLSGLLFVVAGMLAEGMSLSITEIIKPLKNWVRVGLALVANFVLVPLLAYLLLWVFSLDQPLEVGLMLLAAAAGAPVLPKLAKAAGGNSAFAVGLMVVLLVVTIVYMPIVLPLLVDDVSFDRRAIATALIVVMLLPLVIGLLWRSNWPEDAAQWQPLLAKTSVVAFIVLMVVGVGLKVSSVLSIIGTGGIAAMLLFVIGSLLIGLLLGGREPSERSVMALGTAFRNEAAALVVATESFAGTMTVPFILVGALLFILVTLPAARVLGRRRGAAEQPEDLSQSQPGPHLTQTARLHGSE